MQYGMPFLLENSNIEDAARLGAELKLDFVELNLSFPLCQTERVTAEQLRTLKEKYGIYFTFHLDEETAPCSFSTPIREGWLRVTRDAIVLARETGVPTVNVHWPRGIYITLPDRVDYLFNRYREEYRRNTLIFRQVCEEASQGKVLICVENTEAPWQPFQTEAIETLLESPLFGLTLDVGHDMVANHGDAAFYQRYADRLRHMHLHDATAKRCHLPLGTGELDIAALIRRAEDAGARAVVEIKTIAALRDSVKYLKERGLYHA